MSRLKKRVPRHLRDAQRAAKQQHWQFELTRGSHWRWISPEGNIVIVPGTPRAGNRSHENTVADLRRAGLKI